MKNQFINILIVDDHKLIREGFSLMLQVQKELYIETKHASNGEEMFSMLKENQFQMIFLDISMPEITGIEILKELKDLELTPPVIIYTMYNEASYIKKAYLNGAASYLMKTSDPEEIIQAIKIVLQGKKYFNNEVANILFSDMALNNSNQIIYLDHQLLSKREVQIISLYTKGLNAEKIAMFLNISKRTIEGHRCKIFKKLGLKSLSEMVNYGIEHGYR